MSSLMMLAVLSASLLQMGASTGLSGTLSGNSAPKTVAQVLQEKNVGLTIKELLIALKNSDAQVRGFAAIELADQHSTGSIPNIADALSAETVPATRADMGLALAKLGSTTGRISLQRHCDQADAPGYLRIMAARYLLDSDDSGCLSSVISVLKSTADSQEREQALQLLPLFRNAPRQLANRRRRVVAAFLNDSTPAVRIAAAHALADLGGEFSRSALQRRLSREQDVQVRSEIKKLIAAAQRSKQE